MKLTFVGALAVLSLTSATVALAAEPSATPSYSAQFDLPVHALRNCYMSAYRSDALISATPTGDGFIIRRKGETSELVLTTAPTDRSRAVLYSTADGPSHALRQLVRACDRRAFGSPRANL